MHDGVLCVAIENFGCHILEGPESHGSIRIVTALVSSPGEGGNGRTGWKVRRKEASAFRCLTVKDIFGVSEQTVDQSRKHHARCVGSA